MQKDRQWLNSKWWYRLLKVAYFGALACVALVILLIAIDEFAPYKVADNEKSHLVCLEGNERSYTYSEVKSYFYVSYFAHGHIDHDNVAKLCGMLKENYDLTTSNSIFPELGRLGRWEKIVDDAYTLEPVMKTESGWHIVALAFFGWMLVIGLVFELLRRVFYYVLLGTFIPKK